MAIENRDLGSAQQREVYQVLIGGEGSSQLPMATGTTYLIAVCPFPAQVAALQCFGFGVSGSPTVSLDVTRYNSAGVTTITGAVTALTVLGATISQSTGATVSTGASLVSLQTNDLLHLHTGGANSAMTTATVTLVLQALQDIKKHFNN